jgi:hypothetical protein
MLLNFIDLLKNGIFYDGFLVEGNHQARLIQEAY